MAEPADVAVVARVASVAKVARVAVVARVAFCTAVAPIAVTMSDALATARAPVPAPLMSEPDVKLVAPVPPLGTVSAVPRDSASM